MPAVPEGWAGPYSTDLTGSVGDCPGEFPELIADVGTLPADLPAACGACTCSGCKGGSCTANLEMYSTAMCKDSTPVTGTLKPNLACMSVVAPHTSVKLVSFAANLSDVTCTTKVGTVTKKDPVWQDRGRLCGGGIGVGSCDNAEVCVPKLGDPERVCVSRPGDNSCPGAYPERQLVYTGFGDSRDCSCTCTSSLNCNGQVQFGNPQSCNESFSYLAKAGDCWSPSTVYNWERYLWPAPALQTTASAKPIGKLQAQDALTVCCLQ